MTLKPSEKDKKDESKSRLSSNERRQQILQAVVPLFALEGFRGVTTKQLAKQAGVSEALLYQHFPSKEVLYSEVQLYCCMPSEELRLMLHGLQPSTQLLVQLLFLMTRLIVEHIPFPNNHDPLFPRLILHSLLDDGVFARMHFQQVADRMIGVLQSCFTAAREAGDLVSDAEDEHLLFWLCHHTLVAFNMYNLPVEPVVPYHTSTQGPLSYAIMRYMLRGIGLTPQATKKYLNFEALTAQVDQWIVNAGKGIG